jgi:hypothetical protein
LAGSALGVETGVGVSERGIGEREREREIVSALYE